MVDHRFLENPAKHQVDRSSGARPGQGGLHGESTLPIISTTQAVVHTRVCKRYTEKPTLDVGLRMFISDLQPQA